jgi:hypothetical protein
MKTLEKCKKTGIATDWTGNQTLFKCSETSGCKHQRDFGGQKYCSDKGQKEGPMGEKKDEKKDSNPETKPCWLYA